MSRLHRFHRMNTKEYQQELHQIINGTEKSDKIPAQQEKVENHIINSDKFLKQKEKQIIKK